MKTVLNAGAYGHYAAITPSDTVAYADGEAQAIYVGGTGNLKLVRPDGTEITFTGITAGTLLAARSIRVNSTNNTATNLVALYNYKGSK